jgi:hypothetical protein
MRVVGGLLCVKPSRTTVADRHQRRGLYQAGIVLTVSTHALVSRAGPMYAVKAHTEW